jgi:hypothetical protein
MWKLPPPEKRKPWWILPLGLFYGKWFRLERDGEYLCYLSAAVTLLIELILLAAMLLDIVLKTGWLIDVSELREQPTIFLAVFMEIMCKIAPLLVVLFYLRLRLTMDLKNDVIPITLRPAVLKGHTRKRWVSVSLFGIGLGGAVLSLPQTSLIWFLQHYGLQGNLSAIIVAQVLEIGGIAFIMSVTLSCALILEKAIRFFPQAQEDLPQE